MYANVTAMTGYTVKLCFGARIESMDCLADDVLSAAGTAVPHFVKRGEHVECATAIVVERSDSSFAVFRPRDVLAWIHRRERLSGEVGTDSDPGQLSRDSNSHKR